jgi:hypothetical protein
MAVPFEKCDVNTFEKWVASELGEDMRKMLIKFE